MLIFPFLSETVVSSECIRLCRLFWFLNNIAHWTSTTLCHKYTDRDIEYTIRGGHYLGPQV